MVSQLTGSSRLKVSSLLPVTERLPRPGSTTALAAARLMARARQRLVRATAAALLLLLVVLPLLFHLGPAHHLRPHEQTTEERAAQQAALLAQQRAVRQSLAAERARRAAEPYAGFLPEPPPRVALMFLSRGPLPLEPIWQEFFENAAQARLLVCCAPPQQPLPFRCCGAGQQPRNPAALAACASPDGAQWPPCRWSPLRCRPHLLSLRRARSSKAACSTQPVCRSCGG